MYALGETGTQGSELHSEHRSPVTSRQDYVTAFGSSFSLHKRLLS